MNRFTLGFFWISIYLAVILVPLGLMLVPPVPTGRGFWLELSVALGFVGLTQIAVQFVLISRFKSISAPFGIDVILGFHRQIALVAIGLILLHPIIIVLDNPSRLALFNPIGGNWASRSAWICIACLLGLTVTSVFRKELGLSYELWRLIHLVLAVGAVVFAQLHVSMAGLYTNTLWKHLVWVIPATLLVGLVLVLRVVKPAMFPGRLWRVVDVRPEAGDNWTVVLEPDGHKGMEFEPGQFAWITIGRPHFTMQENPFSIRSSAEVPGHLEFGIKEAGDFTAALSKMKPGTPAVVDGPHGAFSIDRYPAVGYVFIAGGVGITPMLSFLHTMADRNDPRPIILLYADRNLEEMPYRNELESLAERLDLKIALVLEDAPEDWDGEKGMIDRAILGRHLPKDLLHREFFICGPPPMMTAVQKTLKEKGVRQHHIHMEKFTLV